MIWETKMRNRTDDYTKINYDKTAVALQDQMTSTHHFGQRVDFGKNPVRAIQVTTEAKSHLFSLVFFEKMSMSRNFYF